MAKLMHIRTILLLTFIMSIALFASSCGEIGASYTPPFVPVTFAIDTSGNISITGNAAIVTEIGTFALTAGVVNTLQPANNTILLVIRHQQNGSIVDTAYQINTQQQVVVVVDGRTTIDVTNQRVMVDASQGAISCIEVKDVNSDNTCEQSTPASIKSNATAIHTPIATTQPTTNPTIVPTTQPSQTCPNTQGQRGTDHRADGTNWTIKSLNGGAFIVNFYFPNTQYSGDYKLLVPEGYHSITLIGGGGSYWLWPMRCASIVQQNYDNPNINKYTPAKLQDLENQGLVIVN